MGRKKRPFYRIVAADSRAPRDGRFIETIGTYDPLAKPHTVKVQEDRIFYWLENGAQPTQTVRSLLRQKGLWLKWDMKKHGADEAKIAEEFAKWELLQIEKSKRMAAEEELKSKAKQKEAEAETEEETQAQPAEQEAPVAEKAPPPEAEEAQQSTEEAAVQEEAKKEENE